MSRLGKQNTFQTLSNSSPVKSKDKEALIQNLRLSNGVLALSGEWQDLIVRRVNSSIKYNYHLEDLYSHTLLKAEPQFSIIGSSYKIVSEYGDLGRLTSNITGSLWTFRDPNKQKVVEITFKNNGGIDSTMRAIEVDFFNSHIKKLKTKEAIWVSSLNRYKLKFSMDELVSSVNNFILEQEEDEEMVEFGKMADGKYKLRVKKNIDRATVFSIMVSALCFKWVCV